MKKLILNMLLLFVITAAAAAQANDPVPMAVTPSTQPENNVLFYNPAQYDYSTEMYRSYWVWDKASVSWVKRVELVAPYTAPVIINSPKTPVYESNNTGRSNTGPVIIYRKPAGRY